MEERKKLFKLKAKCEHVVLIASPNVISTNMTRSNKTTVRSNDESIAIEIGKIAREFAELSSEVASYGIEEDF